MEAAAATAAVQRTVYFGTFVHSKSLEELEICHDTAVCVDEWGVIVAVERNLGNVFKVGRVLERLRWTGKEREEEGKGSVEHVECVDGQGEGASVGEKVEEVGKEVLEHVANGVHVLENGTNGTVAETNGTAKSANGQLAQKKSEVKLVLCGEEQFFFPGFIDTHIHAPQYPNAGIFGKTTLLSWLTKYTFPMESSLSSLPVASRAYTRIISRTLSHGTTTAAYYATISVPSTNLLATLCLQKGQRAFVGRVCMDTLGPDYYVDESAAQSVLKTEECIHHVHSIDPHFSLVSPIITPRFAPSCTSPLLHALGKLAKAADLPIQTHISENAGEIQLVQEMFPDSENYTDVYDTHGLLGPKTILAHAIHLSDAELALIAKRKSKIAHCPTSNACLTSGVARVRWLLDAGVDVGLGTDMGGGYSISVLEATRQAILASRQVAMAQSCEAETERVKLSVEEVLYLATRGGAKVVGLAEKVGGFEVGMEWDAQLIGLDAVSGDGEMRGREGPVDVFGHESWDDKVAKWVFNGDDRNTKKVWVRGRLVHERRD